MEPTLAAVVVPFDEPVMPHATALPTLVLYLGYEGHLGECACTFACQPRNLTAKLRRTSQNRKQLPQRASAGFVPSRLLANVLPNRLGRALATPSQALPELSSTHVVVSAGCRSAASLERFLVVCEKRSVVARLVR